MGEEQEEELLKYGGGVGTKSLCFGVRWRLTSVSESLVTPFPVISKACLLAISDDDGMRCIARMRDV